jgi:hypothetical protein
MPAKVFDRSMELGELQGYEILHIRNGQVRWLPKGDVLGQIQFIREILGLKGE